MSCLALDPESVIMYSLVWETLKCWSSLSVWVELASGLKWPHLSVMVIFSQRGGVHHYQKEIFSYITVYKSTYFSKSVSSKNSLRSLSYYNRYFFQSKDNLISIYFFLSQPTSSQTLLPLKLKKLLKNPHTHTCSAPFFLLLIKWIFQNKNNNVNFSSFRFSFGWMKLLETLS